MSDSVIDNGGGADSNGQSIAVVGMAGRFPKARNLDELWRNVREGRECVSRFSAEEIEEAGVPEAVRTAPNFVPARAILEEPFSFDAPFFGYTPTEAKLTDPQHRLFLECAWEALEHAGYDPAKYPDLVGVYAGADVNTYAIGNILLWTHDLQSLIGNDKDYLSTRVSFKLNLRGPSLTVQTACSTSLVAVQLACQGLLGYQCDLALAGGVGIAFPQKAGYVYHQGSILSPDGHCRPFDARAKGTVGGDGLGLVVLKRLDDALRDGDTIHAVIRGAAINNDGALKVGFTAPSVQGQAEVIAMAQAMAGVSPETITYVEAHGTATELGDPVEIAALTDVFRAGTDKKQFCALGSLKGNVGHMNSAAGVGGLLKTILALGHKELPPSINHEAANPIIDFTGSPFFVNTRLRPWETDGHPRRAGVSSFGVGGTNAHVVLEEAPALRPSGPSRAKQLVVLSAKTESALKAMAANFTEHLGAHPELSLADVAYTLTVGRQLFKYRRMAVCGTLEEARAAFSADLPVTGREPRKPQVVFMFPGQGAQRVDMARELYDSEPTFRDAVDGCAERLRPLLGLDPRTVLYPPAERREEASRRILQTELAQPALFVIEYALAHLWMSWGVTPDAMIGHSVGEYVAACLAEVISLEDALALVAARGRLMQKLPSGAMLAVALSEEEAGKLRSVSVAAVNAPGMVVLSGTHAAIDEVARELQSRGVPATKLHTSHAFHSEMMDPILDELRAVVGKVALSEPRIPYVSNLTGTWISAAEATDPGYWVRHLRQPVRFGAGVAELLAEPDRVLLEVGPGRALSSFAKKHGPNVHERVFTSLEPSRDGASDLESFLHALGRLYLADVAIDWKAYYAAEERRRVPLPTYPFERQPYLREFDATFIDAARNANPLAKRRKVEEWLYLPSWKRAAAVAGEAAAGERWLVFADGAPLGAALAEALERSASDKIVVTPGEAFGQPGPGRFTLRPSEREDYVRLLETISASGPLPGRVLHLWTLPAAAKAKPEERFEALQLRGFLSLLFLARAFAEKAPEHEVRIGVVTTEVASVMGDEPLTPDKATLLAACQVIPQEHARVSCRLLDVTGAAGAERALAARLLGELRADAGEPVVAYRGSHRWVASHESAVSSSATSSGPKLRDGGVYLIAGGLGGLGLSFAEHLARAVKARLVLTSRTGLVRRDEWDAWLRSHNPNDRVSRIIQRIRGIEALGAEVLILSADVADRDQMAEAVAEARRHFGALHGVIHAAGVMGSEMFRAVRDTAPGHCYAHFRPKAQGLFVLDEVLPEGLDFCLLSSSLATVVGGVGFAAYAAANHFMDAFALERNRNGARFPWISVDWDAWQGGGGAEEKGALAAISIRPEEGGEALRAILALGGEQVVVSTVQLDARRAHLKSFQDAAVAKSKEGAKPGATHARPELDTEYVAPRNELEKMLAELWQELLGISPIGVNDNFFRLGGDSLMAIQLATRLRDTLGVDVPVNELFDVPTIVGLAARLEKLRGESQSGIDTVESTLAMIENLSDEEVKRMLAEVGG